ncbi:MAG: flagellar biosynthesis protein FlhB [bacterium]
MAEQESFQEKTEKATPKKIRDAREKGQVARSQELSSVAVMLTGGLALLTLGPMMAANLRGMATWLFQDCCHFTLTSESTPKLLMQFGATAGIAAAPVIGFIAVIAVGVSYLQVGNLFSTKALEPKLDRISPTSGFKRLINARAFFNLGRDILKLAIIVLVAFFAIKREVPIFVSFPDLSVAQIAAQMFDIAFRVAFKVVATLIVIAFADFAWQRFDYFKGLRMTKQEVKDELKQTEGNPLIKGRIRSLQREVARRRMMADVPKADVVVTNPTHVAVALKYDSQAMAAPTVVAKGQRLIAEAIKRIAKEARVPIVENKPLARTLFKTVEIGMQVPASLYRAVAEVLAYVYSLKSGKH